MSNLPGAQHVELSEYDDGWYYERLPNNSYVRTYIGPANGSKKRDADAAGEGEDVSCPVNVLKSLNNIFRMASQPQVDRAATRDKDSASHQIRAQVVRIRPLLTKATGGPRLRTRKFRRLRTRKTILRKAAMSLRTPTATVQRMMRTMSRRPIHPAMMILITKIHR